MRSGPQVIGITAEILECLREDRGPVELPFDPRALHRINRLLWDLEEVVRDRGLDAEAVRELKRRIDAANLRRHRAVAAIDDAVDAMMPGQRDDADPDAVVNSESVGQMVDRLSVLVLKQAAHTAPGIRSDLDRRVGRIMRCLARVWAALQRGDGVSQRFDEAKTYSA
jgi:hypothetical protein